MNEKLLAGTIKNEIVNESIKRVNALEIRPVNTPRSIEWVKKKDVLMVLEDMRYAQIRC